MTISMRPNQKVGADCPISDRSIAVLSIQDDRCAAAMTPKGTETVKAIKTAAMESSMVAGKTAKRQITRNG
jgi:hypothetical protein